MLAPPSAKSFFPYTNQLLFMLTFFGFNPFISKFTDILCIVPCRCSSWKILMEEPGYSSLAKSNYGTPVMKSVDKVLGRMISTYKRTPGLHLLQPSFPQPVMEGGLFHLLLLQSQHHQLIIMKQVMESMNHPQIPS